MIKANEKYRMTSPPRKKSINTTKNVVSDVTMVRLSDSFILLLTVSMMESFLIVFKFSLILSKITMVSFKEYPTIVKKAATTGREISYPSIENIPNVIVTS